MRTEHVGGEALTLAYPKPTETVVTTAHGSRTVYRHGRLLGQPVMFEALGAGCASCPPANVRYGYGKDGQLALETQLDARGRPLLTTRTVFDGHGRPERIERIAFVDGRAQPAQAVARAEYAPIAAEPAALTAAQYAAQWRPRVLARPSVVAGREHVLRIEWNEQLQTTRIDESGFSPIDAEGRLQPMPITRTTVLAYETRDGVSRRVAVDGPLPGTADTTTYHYDELGRLAAIRGPDGILQQVTAFDAAHRPIGGQRGVDLPWDVTLDFNGQPVEWRQGGRALRLERDALGRVTAARLPNGVALAVAYDAADGSATLRDAEGNTLQTFERSDRRLSGQTVHDANGQLRYAELRLFDRHGKLLTHWLPQAVQSFYARDERGRVHSALQGTDGPIEVLARGPTRAVRAADGGVSSVTAVHGGLLVQDALARVHVRVWDDFGRLVVSRDADRGVATYVYDSADRLIARSDALRQTLRWRHDAAGRLLERAAPECTATYRYGPDGRLTEVAGCGESEHWRYDRYGAVVEHEQRIVNDGPAPALLSFVTRYRYDEATGELVERTLPDGQLLRYRYQAQAGRLSAIDLVSPGRLWERATPVLSRIDYAPFGPRERLWHGNGVSTVHRHDRGWRITGVGVTGRAADPSTRAAPALLALDFEHDARGRIDAVRDGGELTRYDYDRVGRLRGALDEPREPQLRSAALAGAGPARINYDALGRRIGEKIDVEHDRLGRVVRRGDLRLTWDSLDRLTKVERETADGTLRPVATYRYNSAGLRIAKTVNGTEATGIASTQYFLYDMQQRLALQADGRGRIEQQFLYLGLQPIAVLLPPEAGAHTQRLVHLHTDALGTPRVATDAAGAVLWRARVDPWGNATRIDAAAMPSASGWGRWWQRLSRVLMSEAAATASAPLRLDLRLPGMLADAETGLFYNVHRYYDPGRGAYLSPDPLGISEGLNQYAYVGQQPLNYSDPWGLFALGTHEDIVREAFRRFQGAGAFDRFSREFIDAFVTANRRTDTTEDYQFERRNHFDNPSDARNYDADRFRRDVVAAGVTWLDAKRDFYTTYDWTKVPTGQLGRYKCRIDMSWVVVSFGQNAHTLADFYAHSNWVDQFEADGRTQRGGAWKQERAEFVGIGPLGQRLYRRVVEQEGSVPTGLGRATLWDETWVDGLYSGTAKGCESFACIAGAALVGPSSDYMHNVFFGNDAYKTTLYDLRAPNPDKRTHAYWAKDEPSSTGGRGTGSWAGLTDYRTGRAVQNAFEAARELAIQHTLKEIGRLYDMASAEQKNIFKMTGSEFSTTILIQQFRRLDGLPPPPPG